MVIYGLNKLNHFRSNWILRLKLHLSIAILIYFIMMKNNIFLSFLFCCSWRKHLYNAHRLIGSQIIESAAYSNHIFMAPLWFNSTQNSLVNWIIWFLLSLLCWPKVILLSGGHCIGFSKFIEAQTFRQVCPNQ